MLVPPLTFITMETISSLQVLVLLVAFVAGVVIGWFIAWVVKNILS